MSYVHGHSQAPALQVEKTFSLRDESAVGESVDFSITVKNEGNVDLVGVALTDAMFQNGEGEIAQQCLPNRSMIMCLAW